MGNAFPNFSPSGRRGTRHRFAAFRQYGDPGPYLCQVSQAALTASPASPERVPQWKSWRSIGRGYYTTRRYSRTRRKPLVMARKSTFDGVIVKREADGEGHLYAYDRNGRLCWDGETAERVILTEDLRRYAPGLH